MSKFTVVYLCLVLFCGIALASPIHVKSKVFEEQKPIEDQSAVKKDTDWIHFIFRTIFQQADATFRKIISTFRIMFEEQTSVENKTVYKRIV